MSESPQKSVQQIEAEIAAARDRLASTVDELHTRTAPKEIARRQAESSRPSWPMRPTPSQATCAPRGLRRCCSGGRPHRARRLRRHRG